MTTQPSPADLTALIALSTENAAPPKSAAARHYMSLTLSGGTISIVFECRHEPVTDERVQCCGESADEYGFDFLEWFNGPESADLRSGLIDIWWDGHGEDAELYWQYVDETRQAREPQSTEPTTANIDIVDMDSVTVLTVDSRHLPTVAIVHGNETSRLLAIGQTEIDRGHGTNIDFGDEAHFERQLLEAVAALRFLREHGLTL